MTPTTELYQSLEKIFAFFNNELFDGKLPDMLFTVQRKSMTMGYFSADRWVSTNGGRCHELAYNPMYVTDKSTVEVLQTLVHEMAHCWQHCHGKPSRSGYHNAQWAKKMESIGLMPSSTGRPGGSRTGQDMNDYPIAGGRFIDACERLVLSDRVAIPWFDRLATSTQSSVSITESFFSDVGVTNESVIEALSAPLITFDSGYELPALADEVLREPTNRKVKYVCPLCESKAWGKPNLNLVCGDCDEVFSAT